ncbi:DUF2867 domain-containing protein [Pseudodesulfovibrio indicus]|uniref:Uncharacterized protein DUF2867 n=1 Tax=Pseudodesulfovibrio indicus TaxID=1716143 RepID=A0A126QK20_9BACT|nr:DUF2867 domain-containing protein [Pseudodesulfovibrio indicus]AMK10137.1 hypothetical protein AWY79_02900 [Pseudodesulfovibrio indicus]TDT87841.1 uncharacterized protein DUF2867 [Pseudodesulfovibrio indicus]
MDRRDVERLPGMAGLTQGADHVDVHTMEGTGSVADVAAALLSHRPGWMVFLWKVRTVLLRLLGQGGRIVPEPARLTGATLPKSVGDKASFLTVIRSDGESHWVAGAGESHLDAEVGVVAEPLAGGRSRFHVVTVVRYRNPAGRIYFNVIRPFHHLVVDSALRAALRRGRNGDQ